MTLIPVTGPAPLVVDLIPILKVNAKSIITVKLNVHPCPVANISTYIVYNIFERATYSELSVQFKTDTSSLGKPPGGSFTPLSILGLCGEDC
jgi:hypothetical protein